MKKILQCTYSGISTNNIFAQTQYGAVVGLNFANVSGDDIEDSKMRLGIRLELFSRELSDAVMLNTGLLYLKDSHMKSIVNLSTFATEKVDANMSFNYLEIPVNFAFLLPINFL